MHGLMRRIEKENDANNDEDKVAICQSGGGVPGVHVGAAVGKTEYTIFCL